VDKHVSAGSPRFFTGRPLTDRNQACTSVNGSIAAGSRRRSVIKDERSLSQWIALRATRLVREVPSGSPVFGLTSYLGKLIEGDIDAQAMPSLEEIGSGEGFDQDFHDLARRT
jgi:hypothetical protein